MSKKPRESVLDEVLANIEQRAPQAWYQRVAPEHADTVNEIRQLWEAGKFGRKKYPAGKAIAKFLHDRGIANVGPQGVIRWLEKA
jgi:hypothetical protein